MLRILTTFKNYWKSGNSLVRAGQTAQVLRQLVLITLALLLPRLNVTTDEIGNWEQMQYLGYLLGFAWLTGIGQAYLAKIRALDPPAARRLTTSLLRLTLSFTVGLTVVFLLLQGPLLQLLVGDGELPGWAFYLAFLLSHWPGLMYEQVLLAQEKGRRLIWFSVVSNLLLLAALVFPLLLGYDWLMTIRLLAAVSLVKALLMLDGKVWSLKVTSEVTGAETNEGKLPALFRQPVLSTSTRNLFSQSLPFVVYAFIGALVVSFDPWLVNYWFEGDERLFAIYRYGTRELPLIVAITNGIGTAVLPELARDRTAGLVQLRSSVLRLMHLFFPAAVLLLLSSPFWWEPLFTDKFADSLPLFQLFIFVAISRFLVPIVIMAGTGHGKALIGLGLIELFLNAVLSIWLVSWLGMIGIVWATIIAYTLDKLLGCWYIYYKEKIPLSAYCAWQWLLVYTSILGLAYWWVSS